MNQVNVLQIEKDIATLPRESQLLLLEHILHRLRSQESEQDSTLEAQMQSMATDPEIQMELRRIDGEFLHTEMDGLERSY